MRRKWRESKDIVIKEATKTRKVVAKEAKEGIKRRVRVTITNTASNRTRVAGARKATSIRTSNSNSSSSRINKASQKSPNRSTMAPILSKRCSCAT